MTGKKWKENSPAVLGGRGRRQHALQQAAFSPCPGAVPWGPVWVVLKEEASLNLLTFLLVQPKPDKQVSPSSAQTAMGCGVRQFNSFLHTLSSLSPV